MLANLCCSLIENGRIKTTLARARALRPTIEKIITLAKKAHLAQDTAKKIHYRRLAISRLRSKTATKKLFDELVEQFATRDGGYTRIYKLALPRLGDASEMALIEFVEEAASKKKKKAKKSHKKSATSKDESKEVTEEKDSPTPVATEVAESDTETVTEDVQSEEATEEESSSDAGEDNTTEEVNDQPEVEESGEDSKVEKEDSEESK